MTQQRVLVLAGLLCAAFVSPALAQPALVASIPEQPTNPPPPPATSYVMIGGAVGVLDNLVTVGPALEGGVQLGGSPLWLHGALGVGDTGELFSTGSGAYVRVNAGLELRGCVLHDEICLIGGGDLGYEHARYTGTDGGWGDDEDDGPLMTTTVDHLLAIPRLGIDAGGPKFRYRATLEGPIELGGAPGTNGITVTGGLAYRW